ncbi:hypothetical protein GCM10010406_18750 [Streptomyces thermolineatus]|uniref:ANTAR domain-containing protein n=1 Tax=Streptomyces thermolineatus TaxID=44033 RepID=A0ABN3LF20_9ACTN
MHEYDRAVADRLARRAVERAAPQELPQFAMTAEAFHSTSPYRRLMVGRRDEPLGLGLETVAALLSAAALAAAVQVLDHISQQAAGRAVETVQRRVLPRFRRRRREAAAGEAAITGAAAAGAAVAGAAVERLSAEQLAEVRLVAVQAAMRLQVSEAQARTIADGIVAELATMTRGPSGGDGPEEGRGEAGQLP